MHNALLFGFEREGSPSDGSYKADAPRSPAAKVWQSEILKREEQEKGRKARSKETRKKIL